MLLGIFLLFIITGCSNNQTNKNQKNQNNKLKTLNLPDIYAIDAKFPLTISNLDFKDKRNMLTFNDGITSKIEETIKEYYFTDCLGDSSETFFSIKDIYFNTIRLYDSLQTVFLVILSPPAQNLNSIVLFYNNTSKEFIEDKFCFKINSLYNVDKGGIIPSNLKKLFNMNAPDIELIDYDKNGKDDFKFTRLYHNGTENAIETIVLKLDENKVDTLDFKRDWIVLHPYKTRLKVLD
jgi:hypothetical protein